MFLTFWQVFITIPQPAVFPQVGSMFPTTKPAPENAKPAPRRNPLESGQCFLLYKLQVYKFASYKFKS